MRPESQLPTQAPPQAPTQTFNTPGMPEIMIPTGETAEALSAARPPNPQTAAASAASPILPVQPDARLGVYRNLLTNFMWSFGRGMQSRKAGQPGSGIGEAILGPWELEERRIKQQQEEQETRLRIAQEERTRAAAEEAMARIRQNEAMLPARVQELFAQAAANRAQVPLREAQAEVAQANVPLVQARTQTELERPAQIQAQTGLTQAQTTTEKERPALIQGQTAVAQRTAGQPYAVDPWGPEAIEAKIKLAQIDAARTRGTSMYERLGKEEYEEMLRGAARARAGVTDETVQYYVEGIAQGNITNLSQVPMVVRGEVLSQLGNLMVISPTDREFIRKMDTAGYLLDRLEAYSELVAKDPTDIEAVATLHGMRQAVGGVFAKGVFAEAGVLTDADIGRVQAIIPGITRSALVPGVAKRQFDELRGIINKAKSNYRRPPGQISGQAKPIEQQKMPGATGGSSTTTPPPNVDFVQQPGGRIVPRR